MGFWINAIIWAIIIGVGMWKAKPQPLTIAFIISLYIGLETYFYVSDWLPYLPTVLRLLFYAIPIVIFLLSFIVYCKMENIDLDEAISSSQSWYICVVIAVWLTFPTVFIFYDWQDAKVEYETEMEELLGEDWEDEIEDMKQELYMRR